MGWRDQPSQPLPYWDTWGVLPRQVSLLVRSPLASAASCWHCGSIGTGIRSGQAMPSESQAQPPRAPLGLAAGMGSLAGSSLWAGEEDASQGLELPQGIHLLHTLHGSEDHSSATVAKAGVHSTWRTYTVLERSWCGCPSCWAGRQSIAVHQPPSLPSHPRLVGPCSTQPDWSCLYSSTPGPQVLPRTATEI